MFHLKGRFSMKYDISKALRLRCPSWARGQNVAKFCSQRPQKTCFDPWFRCFSLSLAHTSAFRNISNPTSLGRSFSFQRTHLKADSGCNKGQLSYLVEAICRDFRIQHPSTARLNTAARSTRSSRCRPGGWSAIRACSEASSPPLPDGPTARSTLTSARCRSARTSTCRATMSEYTRDHEQICKQPCTNILVALSEYSWWQRVPFRCSKCQ